MRQFATPENSLTLAAGGMVSLAAAMGIGRFVYTPILPFMTTGLGLPPADAGLIASANFLGYLLGALAGSYGGLPGGTRSWFLGALLVSALSTAAMAIADTLAVFLFLRFVGGFASAFVLVFSSSLILDRLARAGRPGLSALHFAGVGCGIALSALVIAGLGGLGADWRTMWLASGGITLVLLAAAAILVPDQAETGQPAARTPTATPARTGRLIRLVLAYGLFGFGYVITATFISVIVRDTPALQSAEAYVWLVVGLAAAPSILVWNRISGRLGIGTAFALACMIEACGVALSVVAASPVMIALAAALLGGTFMGITALGLIAARQLTRGNPRRILAIMTASFGTGQVIGPSLAGHLHALSGSFESATLIASAALVLAAALVGLTPNRKGELP